MSNNVIPVQVVCPSNHISSAYAEQTAEGLRLKSHSCPFCEDHIYIQNNYYTQSSSPQVDKLGSMAYSILSMFGAGVVFVITFIGFALVAGLINAPKNKPVDAWWNYSSFVWWLLVYGWIDSLVIGWLFKSSLVLRVLLLLSTVGILIVTRYDLSAPSEILDITYQQTYHLLCEVSLWNTIILPFILAWKTIGTDFGVGMGMHHVLRGR